MPSTAATISAASANGPDDPKALEAPAEAAPAGPAGLPDRAFARLGRRYADVLKAVPGMLAGVVAGGAMVAYIFFSVDVGARDRKVLAAVYIVLAIVASAADSKVFDRQTPRLRAFLKGGDTDDRRALLAEVAGLGRATIRRVAGLGAVISVGFIGATAWLLHDPMVVLHAGIGAGIGVALQVIFAYLITQFLARPVYASAVEAADDSQGATGEWGFLGRKLLYLSASAQLIPLMFVVAMVYQKTRHLDGIAPVVQQVLLVSSVSAATFLLLTVALVRAISDPVSQLALSMDRVVQGDYGVRTRLLSDDDLGLLTSHFNRMTAQLARDRDDLETKNRELKEWSETLEVRIAERTRELEETRRAAVHAEKMAALGILLSGVGHELNNPLGQVTGNSENLSRDIPMLAEALRAAGGADPQLLRRADMMVRAIQNVKRGAERMRTIVRSLEVLSRGNSDPVRRCRARTLAEEAVALIRGDRRWAETRFEVDIAEDVEVDVFENAILQVLINLSTNAVQAMGGTGTLRFSAATRDGHAVLTVEDSGPGIPPENLEKIFAPFYTTKAPGEGTGLGLSIVHDLVAEKHCGSIRVSNRPEGGARFDVLIPLDLAQRYKKAA